VEIRREIRKPSLSTRKFTYMHRTYSVQIHLSLTAATTE
jgi:hypothetical protein